MHRPLQIPGAFPKPETARKVYLTKKYFNCWRESTSRIKKKIALAKEIYEFNKKAYSFLLWVNMTRNSKMKKMIAKNVSFSAKEEDLPPISILKQKPGASRRIPLKQNLQFSKNLEQVYSYRPVEDKDMIYIQIISDKEAEENMEVDLNETKNNENTEPMRIDEFDECPEKDAMEDDENEMSIVAVHKIAEFYEFKYLKRSEKHIVLKKAFQMYRYGSLDNKDLQRKLLKLI
ncbi:3775_t:CDS:2 [Acaulospora colombiana]|uniref:3775_t:CDS:1 n=1 Tax=Acaulospora colombiana TaxID=27376 RepID=A0ACA9KC12_9GLOM|nr:3775_t:CDS:2 [Acaulospora colombiana]